METLFVSPSKLEVYRRYMNQEWRGSVTLQNVVDYIKGVKVWSPKMNFGTAYHYLLEHGPEKYLDHSTGKYVVFRGSMPEPVIFTEPQVEPVIYFREKYPRMVYETIHYYPLEVGGKEICLGMIIDGLNGLEVHEQKTVEGEFNFTNYARSLQWKIYLLATGANLIQYNVFEYKRDKLSEEILIKYKPFKLYPYAEMEGDVMGYVSGFLNFCESMGLTEYLKKSFVKP
jgi:hypothetical protein